MLKTFLEQYQEEFAQFVNAKSARATALGRQALVLLLKALNVNDGDRIGVCAFTCLSVIEAIKVIGASPIYLDVDEHLCIDPIELSRQPKNSLKAVILQHTFGNPGKFDNLIDACKKIDALIIEDCAHALGCYWNGKHLGSFGQGAIYSFQWGKPYTTGQGGMVTVNSDDTAQKIDNLIEEYALPQNVKTAMILETQRKIRSLMIKINAEPRIRSLHKLLKNTDKIKKRVFDSELKLKKGYIRIPDFMTVKEGLKQIEHYPEILKQRRGNVEFIESLLEKRGLQKWGKKKQADLTLLRYPLFVNNKHELLRKALRNGWDVAGWYDSPVHPLMDNNLAIVGYKKCSAANAEKLIKQLIHLPTYNISEKKVELIIGNFF